VQTAYDTAAQVNAGRPETAPPHVLEEARKRTAESRKTRGEIAARAAARLG